MKILPSFQTLALAGTLLFSQALQAQDVIDIDDLLGIDELSESESDANSASIADPFEGLNRAIFNFNDKVYKKIFTPFTRQYTRVVPKEARKGMGNFFTNLEYPVRFTGSVLQLKLKRASQETGKFLVDTTAGLGGFLAPSNKIEALQTSREDIGQALGAWGVKHGFYIVIPFIGPSSARDLVGRFGGDAVEPIPEPWSQVDNDTDRIAFRSLETINELPQIIDLYHTITDSAIDPYIAVRDGYAQLRANLVEE